MVNETIHIAGAREHNLKNITVTIPRNKLVVITGPSGSGKSSLAFDTLYAEGQRRYVESLSAYARQFLNMMQKPDVDSIDGLSPAISIEQKTTSKNPRSTVGTITEIYDYLRVLFARIGVPYSPATGKPIFSQTVSQMVDRILLLEEGTKILLLAPIVRGRKGEYKKDIDDLRKKGFQRLHINGVLYDIDETPALDKKLKHTIRVVIDRLVVRPDLGTRLAQGIETALHLSDGLAEILTIGDDNITLFSSRYSCPESGFVIDELEPRLFSFNSPYGACSTCGGLGIKVDFDPGRIIPDPHRPLIDGAIKPWNTSFRFYYHQVLGAVLNHYKIPFDTPYEELSQTIKDIVLYGSKGEKIPMALEDSSNTYRSNKAFEGVIPNLQRRYENGDDKMKEELSVYQSQKPCLDCHGMRVNEMARAVKITSKHIGEICQLSISEALSWFQELPGLLTTQEQSIADRLIKEIHERLFFLSRVGLNYLTLNRTSGTLSGGESQRIRLASQIGSGLTGVMYVLDEPSIGLHQRDNDRLLETLKHLRDLGNTVIVVEHDEDAMRMADYLIDMGPGAGSLGGQVVDAGHPDEVIKNNKGITAAYLSGKEKIAVPTERRKGIGKNITIRNATTNNLRNLTVDFPLGTFTCVTGVSGGGKSSLVIETLYKALARKINGATDTPGAHESLEGVSFIDKIIDIDQSPIGRTPRSNPATYTGVFGPIRDWFTGLPEAKVRGYKAGRFSFNVKGGRCEACQGDGVIKIEMHFLADVYVTCDQCKGHRYNRETLEVRYKNKSIADVLDMTVDEGADFFAAIPTIANRLVTLQKVGLGYMHIGQRATTLSGGEAQRIKLSKELSKRATGRTLYILDEPTTGLHFDDIRKLLEVLHTLVDQGNTVVVIEHNLDVIKTADWIIDIGPEGGDGGGQLVIADTPENVAMCDKSFTGKYLKACLKP
ncbi:MAG: excinuclease ABC subunit UvrA [Alphaproteobacteria bacterium]|nr:MAG: excinuclease ABC subunit UvrA [Alphaproteobacteria bacterium]